MRAATLCFACFALSYLPTTYAQQPPSIVGVTLGMPNEEALRVLTAYDTSTYGGKMKIYATEASSSPILHGAPPKGYVYLARLDNKVQGFLSPQVAGDVINVVLSLPPEPQRVIAIGRELQMMPSNGIPRATLLAQLREKYGRETDLNGNFAWFFDESNRPMSPPPASKEPGKFCYDGGYRDFANRIPRTPGIKNGSDAVNPACGKVLILSVSPRGDIVQGARFVLMDHRAYLKALEAAHAFFTAQQQGAAKSALDDAKARPVPKL